MSHIDNIREPCESCVKDCGACRNWKSGYLRSLKETRYDLKLNQNIDGALERIEEAIKEAEK